MDAIGDSKRQEKVKRMCMEVLEDKQDGRIKNR